MLKLDEITIKEILINNNELKEILKYIKKTNDFEYLKKCYINNYYLNLYNNEIIAKYYLTFASFDMMGYIDSPDVNVLLKKDYNKKTLLEYMLDFNFELTINKILSPTLKNTLEIAIILEKYNYQVEYVNIQLFEFENNKLKKSRNDICFENDSPSLIKLANLFLEDSRSDEDLIKTLISSFRTALLNNYDRTTYIIDTLISIKENHPKSFNYLKNNKVTEFDAFSNGIMANINSECAVLHETGHAIHYYNKKFLIPNFYNEEIINLRNDLSFKKRIMTFLNDYYNATFYLEDECIQEYNKHFELYQDKSRISLIKMYLSKEKIKNIKRCKIYNYDPLYIEKYYSFDNYLKCEKQDFLNKTKCYLKQTKYIKYSLIGDIIDAITGGIFNLLSEDTLGHGIPYYIDVSTQFKEIIANLFVIYNMKDYDLILEELRYLIGDNLFIKITDFYETQILENNSILNKKN